MALKTFSRSLAVLGGLGFSLCTVVLVGSATRGEEIPAPPAVLQQEPPAGDASRLMECRLAQLRLREMPGYEMKSWSFSNWQASRESFAVISGIRYLWIRQRDGLELDMDVAVFSRPRDAQTAAEIRLDQLGLAPQPVTREKAGEGQARFTSSALEGPALGERCWSRRVTAKGAQQVVVIGRMVVCVTARHEQVVDTGELMRLARIIVGRPPKAPGELAPREQPKPDKPAAADKKS